MILIYNIVSSLLTLPDDETLGSSSDGGGEGLAGPGHHDRPEHEHHGRFSSDQIIKKSELIIQYQWLGTTKRFFVEKLRVKFCVLLEILLVEKEKLLYNI